MKRRIFYILLFTTLITTSAHAEVGRIISLKPTITDAIIAMGHGDKLVGITKYCDTEKLKNRPAIVGDYTHAYIERIIALEPDIVIGSKENSSRKSISRLEDTGVRVRLFSFTTIDETLKSIRGIGNAIGAASDGAKLAQNIESKLKTIEDRWKDAPDKRVVLIVGRRPLIAAGHGSYLNELLKMIGAKNAVKRSKIPYPRISTEELIAIDPDAIVDLSMGSETGDTDGRGWSRMKHLKAVRQNRVYIIDTGDLLAGPDLPEGLEKLARMIHEETKNEELRTKNLN